MQMIVPHTSVPLMHLGALHKVDGTRAGYGVQSTKDLSRVGWAHRTYNVLWNNRSGQQRIVPHGVWSYYHSWVWQTILPNLWTGVPYLGIDVLKEQLTHSVAAYTVSFIEQSSTTSKHNYLYLYCCPISYTVTDKTKPMLTRYRIRFWQNRANTRIYPSFY